jgi:hypothetical protein
MLWLVLVACAAVASIVAARTSWTRKGQAASSPSSKPAPRVLQKASLRGALTVESALEFCALSAGDAMVPASRAPVVLRESPIPDQLARLRGTARYLAVRSGPAAVPDGYLDLAMVAIALAGRARVPPSASALVVESSAALSDVVDRMSASRTPAAVVVGADGSWSGWLTIDEIARALVGDVRGATVRVGDLLRPAWVQDVDVAGGVVDVVREALSKVPLGELPMPAEWLALAAATQLADVGAATADGVAIVHARLYALGEPIVVLARPSASVPGDPPGSSAQLVFALFVPAECPWLVQDVSMAILALVRCGATVWEGLRRLDGEALLALLRAAEGRMRARAAAS